MSKFEDDLFAAGSRHTQTLGSVLGADALEGVARAVVGQLAARRHLPELVADPDHPAPRVIDSLCDALVADDPEPARRMMRKFQRDGLSLEVLYARYLAAAAVRLGILWEHDRLSFSGVTIALGRIYDIVRLLRDNLPPPSITRDDPVLFATVPGEEHGLGAQMAAELFRQRGWDVHVLTGATHEDIMDQIGMARFLVVGLSSGGRRTAEALAQLIHAVRFAYPETFILVSGRIVSEEAELIAALAPDSAVETVEDALATIEALAAR